MIDFLLLTIIAVIAVLVISRVNALSQRVLELEWEFRKLKESTKSETARKETPPVVPAPPATSPASQPTPHVSQTAPQVQARPAEPTVNIPMPPPSVTAAPSRTREEWESFVGGKLLNRIGALALVIGVGFFLKYAIDNNWITESMRVAIGVCTGIGILLGAVRAHRKTFEIFAQGLFGAGISILYLSVYAAFNFYHLVSQPVAFVAMSVVTASTFAIGLRYDSLAISILAWAGGFLTPFLLSTREANEVGLFSYIALLQAGLLAITMKKPSWIILEMLTLFGTYLVFLLWYQAAYAEDALSATISFLTLFWAMFFLADLRLTFRKQMYLPEVQQLAGLFNVGVYFLFMYVLIDPVHHEWMGATTLAICFVYLSRVLVPALRPDKSSKSLAQNVLTAIVLFVIATAIQFEGFTTVIFWSLEAAALIWCGIRWNYRYMRITALALLFFAFSKFAATPDAFTYSHADDFSLFFNYRTLTYAALALATGASAVMLSKTGAEKIHRLVATLHAAWIVVVFGWITVEVNDFFALQAHSAENRMDIFEYAKIMTLICCWILYSLPLVYSGLKTKSVPVLISGLLVVTAAIMAAFIRGIAFSPIDTYQPLLNVRMLGVMVAIAGSYLHGLWLHQHRSDRDWIADVNATLAIIVVLLFLWLLTGETRDLFERQIVFLSTGSELTSAENLKQLSLSGLWLLYGIGLMVAGIVRRAKGLRLLSIALLGISILKIFVYDLSFLETLYRIFSFMGLGVILLGASYLYQRYKSFILETEPHRKDA